MFFLVLYEKENFGFWAGFGPPADFLVPGRNKYYGQPKKKPLGQYCWTSVNNSSKSHHVVMVNLITQNLESSLKAYWILIDCQQVKEDGLVHSLPPSFKSMLGGVGVGGVELDSHLRVEFLLENEMNYSFLWN